MTANGPLDPSASNTPLKTRGRDGHPMWGVVSPREARLVFWLVVIALLLAIVQLSKGFIGLLAWPAVILFIAWLLAYVLDPAIGWLQRHLPFRSRGLSVAITYVATGVTAFVVIGAAVITLLNAAVAFVDQLPEILTKVGDLLRPIVEALGLSLPDGGDLTAALQRFLAEYGSQLGAAATAALTNLFALFGGLFTAVVISVGIAAGQVSLLGWLRRFLPENTYHDLTELERAIAVSFGGFVRGRGLIGLIFGLVILVASLVLGVPYGPLIATIAGVIVFIPWIGPLIGWAILPAFALILAPEAIVPSLIVSVIGAAAIQLVVTQLVMGAAVKMSPVAVFAVVIVGTSLAGVAGAVFAIPTAAAILAVTDYLRRRDVLLRPTGAEDDRDPAHGGEAASR